MSLSSSRLRSTTATTHSATTSSTDIPSPSSPETPLWSQASDSRLYSRIPRRGRSSPRPLLRTAFSSFTGFATVIIGEENSRTEPATTYLVHKELLASASPFFAAALNGTFAEGLDQRIRLSEEKPEIFEWFLQWLYTGTLTTQPACAEPMRSPPTHGTSISASRQPGVVAATTTTTPSPLLPAATDDSASCSSSAAAAAAAATAEKLDGDLRNAAGSPKYFLLLDLYALAERLLVAGLGNDVLSTIARLSETTNSVPTPSDTWLLYDGAAGARTGARARALVLDLFAYKKTDRLLETHRDEWHPRFLRELAVRLKRPGRAALERHQRLVAWRPRSWSQTRACEGCRDVLRPGVGSGDRCAACDKAFCNACLRRHALGDAAFAWPHEPSGCKPWAGRGMCLRYHEHADGEVCG